LIEDSSIDLFNLSRKIRDISIKKLIILKLVDLEGDLLNNNSLTVTPEGLDNSLRKADDGVTFFGFSSLKDKSSLVNKVSECDYYLNDENLKYNNIVASNPYFAIYYDQNDNSYYIKSCRNSQLNDNKSISDGKDSQTKSKLSASSMNISILLIKMSKPMILKRKELIVIGGGVLLEVNAIGKELLITKLAYNDEKKSYKFSADDITLITLGRGKDCTVAIDDSSLSKTNLTFKYSKMNIASMNNIEASNKDRTIIKFLQSGYKDNTIVRFWEIYDGTINKPSTNGIWLFATHAYKIYHGLIIKLNKSKIQINTETLKDL
jgi:hypothetical protein